MLTTQNLTLVDGEPRVLDLDLAAELGFERPRVIRELITRNEAELAAFSGVCRAVRQISSRGGRPSTEYWLTEAQALLLCMFARTATAAAVRRQVIEVFLAWRKGHTEEVNFPQLLKQLCGYLEPRGLMLMIHDRPVLPAPQVREIQVRAHKRHISV